MVIEQLRRLFVGLALAGVTACSGNRPPVVVPTPPPPSPQCAEGQTTCCWHQPPGNEWLYACPAPNVEGGVLNVAGGPAQCPNQSCGSTPEPTPPPTDVSVPEKGTPVGGDIMLRVHEGNAFLETNVEKKRVDIFSCIACCMGWEKVPNQGWPNVSAPFIDECRKFGANMFHLRLGPWVAKCKDENDPGCGEVEWTDIGGPYNDDGTWNAKYWSKVRELVWKIHVQGSYVEVVPIDTWYIKTCHFGSSVCAWPKSAIDEAFNGVWNDYADKLVRKSVEELGCFGNVIAVTGNEEDLVNMKPEWLNKFIETWRDAESKTGCNLVHILGTGSELSGVNADYQVTHSRTPITGPCNGRWCYNNEHNPEFSVEEEASLFEKARQHGQAWGGWRAEAKDADWEARLKRFQEIVGGSAPSTGCYVPPSELLEDWEFHDNSYRQPQADISQAVTKAKQIVGERCGQTGPSDSWSDPQAAFGKQFETIAAVAEEVRKQGFCASGPWGDALAVTRKDGLVEERHIVAYSNGCWTNDSAVNPKSYWRWLRGTVPQPPGSLCTNPASRPIDHFNVKEHTKGPNKTVIDSTPIVHDAAYCASIGMSGLDCPVRPEGDPARAACEAEVATPVWTEMPTGASVSPENPYQLWVPRGHVGVAKVCASQNMGACGQVQVTP